MDSLNEEFQRARDGAQRGLDQASIVAAGTDDLRIIAGALAEAKSLIDRLQEVGDRRRHATEWLARSRKALAEASASLRQQVDAGDVLNLWPMEAQIRYALNEAPAAAQEEDAR